MQEREELYERPLWGLTSTGWGGSRSQRRRHLLLNLESTLCGYPVAAVVAEEDELPLCGHCDRAAAARDRRRQSRRR